MVMSVDLANLGAVTTPTDGAIAGKSAQAGQGSSLQKTIKANKSAAQNGSQWSVPKLPANYNLTQAKATAYAVAQNHMNKLLGADGLQVQLQVNENAPETTPQEITATVTEKKSEKHIKTYNGLDVLRLFTHNAKQKGIIADGTI